MPIATGTALLAAGALGAGGSVVSSLFGRSAASKAADQQAQQQEKSLQFQKDVYADQKANQQPFVDAGQYSIGKLLESFKNGTFGPGSIPSFTAPTAAEAQATPGYQFTKDQGEQSILRGAAASGGAFTGGTLKSLAGFGTGLADSAYSSRFAQAMAQYNALLGAQNQSFNQLSATASLGENAAANVGNNGAQAANTIGNTLTNIGSAQAAGTIGGANAISQGIGGVANSLSLPLYLQYLNGQGGGASDPSGFGVATRAFTPPPVSQSVVNSTGTQYDWNPPQTGNLYYPGGGPG